MPASDVLADVYAAIREPMAAVEACIRRELDHPNPYVRVLAEHARAFAGKRVRPALLLTSARACGGVREEHVLLAAVVELIHHATLVHDDVLDSADRRRHASTLNARWGNCGPVLFGDFIFARAFRLCAELNLRHANVLLARTAETMCVGELTQTMLRGHLALGEEEYLTLIRQKTASLFGTACRLGAILPGGGESPCAGALEGFGTAFGMAFQITDDYLDIAGDEQEAGKSLGTDLEEGKATLPILLLRGALPERAREELDALWAAGNGHPDRRARIAAWLREAGVEDQVRARARRFIEEAVGHLRALPPGPAVEALEAIARSVPERRS